MLILSELGLHVDELQVLETSNFNLENGTRTFYRQKVNITQIHRLTSRLWEVAKTYINQYANGMLTDTKMSIRAIVKRIAFFGLKVSVKELSPHDLRHHWTTRLERKTSLDKLMLSGGWAAAWATVWSAVSRFVHWTTGSIIPQCTWLEKFSFLLNEKVEEEKDCYNNGDDRHEDEK